MDVLIIGAGRVGSSFGFLLNQSQFFTIVGVYNRHYESASKAVKKIGDGLPLDKSSLKATAERADLIVITTPDDIIREVAETVNNYNLKNTAIIMHMSGLHSSDILNTDNNINRLFSLHPLQAIPDFKEGVKLLPETTYTLEGNTEGLKQGKKIIEKLGFNYYVIETEYKPLYHAAAVFASNYLVSLLDISFELLREADILNSDIKKGLFKLVYGTLENVDELGTKSALTGPIARGDFETIKKHQDALNDYKSSYLALYNLLGSYTADMVNRKDLKEMLD